MISLFSLKAKLLNNLLGTYWTVGISTVKDPTDYCFADIKWIIRQRENGWIADPFILDYDDKTVTLLVEEYPFSTGKGQISKVVIDRQSLKELSLVPLIVQSTHMSFPFIIRTNEGIFVCPENYRTNSFDAYKLSDDGNECVKVNNLAEGMLTDTVVFEKSDGKYVMLTTKEPDSNGKTFFVYESDNILEGYKETRSIKLDENSARNAGQVILYDGKKYKVSQDNNSNIYGRGVVIQEMDDDYNLRVVNRILPSGNGWVGTHTMNVYGDLVVWDGKKYYHNILGPILASIINFYQKYIK